MSLRIGFDAKRIFHNHTGLGNYGRTLIRNLHNYYPEVEIVLFTPSIVSNKDTRWILNQKSIKIITPPNSSNKHYWRLKGVKNDIKDQNLDIYHGLSNELPFLGNTDSVMQVVTIHDLIFKYFKKQYTYVDRMIYHAKSKYALANANKIIAISESTKHDILKYYQPNEEKIEVIYQSCGIEGSSTKKNDKSYFLFVSGLNERKGLKEILIAMNEQSVERRKLLKIVGTGGSYENIQRNFIEKNGLNRWVEFLGKVSNVELKSLYEKAIALVYPSFAEGFGIPIIEALSVGTHVITCDHSAMPEAAGNLGHYIRVGDTLQLKEMLNKAPYFKEMNKEKLADHLSKFKGKTTADQLMTMYKDLHNHPFLA